MVNGTYSLQKEWMLKTGMPWEEEIAQEEAKDMYERMFTMKFLPPGVRSIDSHRLLFH